jgi:DoxX-like family
MEAVRIVLDILPALLVLFTGAGKLAGVASSHAIRDSLNVAARRWKLIGGLEMLAVIGLVTGIWIPVTGLAAALGVVALMIGAIIIRRQAGQGWAGGVAADTVVLLVAATGAVLNALAI